MPAGRRPLRSSTRRSGPRAASWYTGAAIRRAQIEIYLARCFCRGVDRSDWQQEYFQNYYEGDEHLPQLRALPDSKIVHVTDLFSDQELKTSPTYNEVLARFHAQNSLHVRLDGPEGSRIVWVIADPIKAGGWSSSQVDMIARLLPYLRQYVRVRSVLAETGALGSSATELLGNARAGVIHLDRGGRMVEVNDRARELLCRNDGLFHQFGTLHAAAPQDDHRLQELLGRALPPIVGQGASGSMTVRRPSLLPRLALHVKPVAIREVDYRSRSVAALVLIVDPMDRVGVEPEFAQEVLGLTPTEAEIAIQLAQGRTPRQIAAATGRGYSTVRTHLKHIFSKLGVSRQFEVAQIVFALSSLPKTPD